MEHFGKQGNYIKTTGRNAHIYKWTALEGIVIIRFLPIIRCCVSYMQDNALHAYNNRERNQTTSVIYYYGWVYSFCFFFLTGASLTYMTIENLSWRHLIGHGLRSGGHIWSRPANVQRPFICPQRTTAATCTNVTHHQLHAACYQLKA